MVTATQGDNLHKSTIRALKQRSSERATCTLPSSNAGMDREKVGAQ
ncbi:hypothetical protein KDA_11150 [Dictyobacter alpinus]|uniref:Uncharacterized protein n=1 Tax=Dictyobacter alpinus TaxID=2014873 RepID=A0A402B2Q5_9CHLR|nr:hypothetical protein [Dictyobacter alpinus]GCE25631.1 hypothetical protein KDA_11150 [Dictyobacter alpinus]